MIILNLKDGLGNQLFEYAYARQMQLLTNEKIYINTYFFRRLKDRTPSLQYYRLNSNVHFLNKYKEFAYTLIFFAKLSYCLGFKKIWNWAINKKRPNDDSEFLYFAHKGLYYSFVTFNNCGYPQSNAKYKFVHGNFESRIYFEGLEEIFNKEILLVNNLTQQQKKLLELIVNTNSVCVHIRRGDYLDPKWAAFNVCNYSYYKSGMEYVQKHIERPVYFIFSNTPKDIEWIKENFQFDSSMQIYFVDCGGTDIQDFELMRNCKHFIISNSTYSWWAANLSINKDKIVVAPKTWYKGSANCENMYLDSWKRI